MSLVCVSVDIQDASFMSLHYIYDVTAVITNVGKLHYQLLP